jgi:hypothetical protein
VAGSLPQTQRRERFSSTCCTDPVIICSDHRVDSRRRDSTPLVVEMGLCDVLGISFFSDTLLVCPTARHLLHVREADRLG